VAEPQNPTWIEKQIASGQKETPTARRGVRQPETPAKGSEISTGFVVYRYPQASKKRKKSIEGGVRNTTPKNRKAVYYPTQPDKVPTTSVQGDDWGKEDLGRLSAKEQLKAENGDLLNPELKYKGLERVLKVGTVMWRLGTGPRVLEQHKP